MVPSHLPQPVASANAPIQGAPGATDASSGESSAEGAAFDCALDSVCTTAPQLDETVPEVPTQAGAAIMSDWWLSLGSESSPTIGEESSDDEDEDGNIAEDAAQNPAAVITADVQAQAPATPPAQTQSPEPWAATSTPGVENRAASAVGELPGRETSDAQHEGEQAPESAPWTPQPVTSDAVSRHASRETTITGTASTASVAASEVGQTASREHAPAEVIEKVADLRPTPAAMAHADMAPADVSRADREASTGDASAAVRAAAQRTPAAATGMATSAARTGGMPTASTPPNQNAAQLPPAAAPLPERTAAVAPTASVLPAAHTGHDRTGILATDQGGDGQVEIEEQHPVQTAAAATITGSAAASQGRQDFSGTERQTSQENPPAATRFAGAAPMTLVVAPDGTFRLTPAAATFILPPTLMSNHESTENVDQMIQTMRVMIKDRVTEATVHLRPEHFGEVSIEIRVDGKSVTARVQTDSPAVREWLQSQEAAIRSGLLDQGLTLDRLQVERDARHPRREPPAQQPQPRRQRRMPAGDAQQTFEVSV